MKNVKPFFATPVFQYDVNMTQELHRTLLRDLYAWQEKEVGIERSNNSKFGWHSEVTLFSRKEDSIKALCAHFLKAINTCTLEITDNKFELNAYNFLYEGWVNINKKGGYNAPHDHPGYLWSAVYYAKIPTPSDAKSKSGILEFLDPRTNIVAMAPEIAEKSPFFIPKIQIRPKENTLIVFPSYLRHWVYPNEEDEDRISIAFNVKYLKDIK